MRIIRYDPFKEIERFFDDDFFGFVPAVNRNLEPAMDLYQTEQEVVVELQVPKMAPDKISVSVEDGVLRVEGRQEEDKKEEGKEYFRREIRRGSFVKMISLPVAVKEDQTKASFEHGVLKITLPKVEAKHPKKVEIEVK